MKPKEYLIKHVKLGEFFTDDVVLECGHGRQEYTIVLRQMEPTVIYVCCPGCYHMILGDMLERAFTLKT